VFFAGITADLLLMLKRSLCHSLACSHAPLQGACSRFSVGSSRV